MLLYNLVIVSSCVHTHLSPNVLPIKYKLGPEWLTRPGNSKVHTAVRVHQNEETRKK